MVQDPQSLQRSDVVTLPENGTTSFYYNADGAAGTVRIIKFVIFAKGTEQTVTFVSPAPGPRQSLPGPGCACPMESGPRNGRSLSGR